MESQPRIEQSPIPDERQSRREERDFSREAQQIGGFLNEVWRELDTRANKQLSENGRQELEQRVRFIFRPRSDHGSAVFVDATEFNFAPQPHDPRAPAPLRNFHVTLRHAEPDASRYEWNVEELVGSPASNYELSSISRGSLLRARMEEGDVLPSDFKHYRDPSAEEVSEAVQIMQDAWELYRKGDHTTLEFQHQSPL